MSDAPPPPPPKPAPVEAPPDVGTPYHRVFAGRRHWPDGKGGEKFVYVWFDCDADGVLRPGQDLVDGGRGAANSPKKAYDVHAFVGAVYRFTPTADGEKVWTKGKYGPKFVRSTTGEHIAGWSAADRAAEARLDADKRMEQAEDRVKLRTILAPIREMYQRTNARGRRALLVAVLDAISGGGL